MPSIIDVIIHQPKAPYSAQIFVVLDVMPALIYERDGNRLTSNDDGLYDFLAIEPGTSGAFAGRKFELKLADGTTYECRGQVWSVGPIKGLEALRNVGIGTVEGLRRCNVFSGAYISAAKLDAWLEVNAPSTEYDKYDERAQWWKHVRPTLRIVRNRKRAARLRKRGEAISWEPRLNSWAWKRREARA